MEHGLRPAIVAGLRPALRARLAGMPGVDLDDLETVCLCFILNKRVELGKAPTVQAALLRSLTLCDSLADVRQVLKHQGTPWWCGLDHPFGKDVIVVSALPKLFLAQLLEMSPGRASAFGLKFSR